MEYIIDPIEETRGRPRAYHKDRASTSYERSKNSKARRLEARIKHVGVIDMETDPFDDKTQEQIFPFAACIYSPLFEPVQIWEDDFDVFVERLLEALEYIEQEYGAFTFYAHNGGKFDYMFIMHKLRGEVSFKGAALMKGKIGGHEIRDSLHIIPEKLAAYRKEAFDYNKMKRAIRLQHKEEIQTYLLSDCVYLYEIVASFLNKFGFKISIGQAAMAQLRKYYPVNSIGDKTDEALRQWFFGGRVECLAGRGHFTGDYKLYDVNSMYPYVMASFAHPISANYQLRRRGGINEKTVFLEVKCRNWGALVRRGVDGTTATEDQGTFFTTIWEFETALDLGLIEDIEVLGYIDNDVRTTFEKFVEPLYEARQQTKERLKVLDKLSREYQDTKKDDIFYKLLLNNAYGKFAQNPRRFKEHYITEPDERPVGEEWANVVLPHFQSDKYWIWQRPPSRFKFNNVGTAASITGAARATLLRAINGALDPIYCDTDSVICRDISGVNIHATQLGAWDLEAEFSEVLICGKKLYACKPKNWSGLEADIKVKSKGASGIKWQDMLRMLNDETLPFVNRAPTLTKFGRQYYTTRNIKATAPVKEHKRYAKL